MKICIGQKGKEKKKTDLSCFVVLGARSGSLSRKHLTEPFLESAGTQGQGVRGLCCPGGAGCCLGCALVKSGRESADLLCLVPESGLCTTEFPEPLSGQLENCLSFFLTFIFAVHRIPSAETLLQRIKHKQNKQEKAKTTTITPQSKAERKPEPSPPSPQSGETLPSCCA